LVTEDFVWGLGQHGRVAAPVPAVDQAADGDHRIIDARDAAVTDGLAGDDFERTVTELEPLTMD